LEPSVPDFRRRQAGHSRRPLMQLIGPLSDIRRRAAMLRRCLLGSGSAGVLAQPSHTALPQTGEPTAAVTVCAGQPTGPDLLGWTPADSPDDRHETMHQKDTGGNLGSAEHLRRVPHTCHTPRCSAVSHGHSRALARHLPGHLMSQVSRQAGDRTSKLVRRVRFRHPLSLSFGWHGPIFERSTLLLSRH
jgi:hypothetical protein